jgi:hypothetical protein
MGQADSGFGFGTGGNGSATSGFVLLWTAALSRRFLSVFSLWNAALSRRFGFVFLWQGTYWNWSLGQG